MLGSFSQGGCDGARPSSLRYRQKDNHITQADWARSDSHQYLVTRASWVMMIWREPAACYKSQNTLNIFLCCQVVGRSHRLKRNFVCLRVIKRPDWAWHHNRRLCDSPILIWRLTTNHRPTVASHSRHCEPFQCVSFRFLLEPNWMKSSKGGCRMMLQHRRFPSFWPLEGSIRINSKHRSNMISI